MRESVLRELLGHYEGRRGRTHLVEAFRGQELAKGPARLAARLASAASLTACRPGECIYAESAPGRGRLYFLLYGAMTLTVNDRALKELQPGQSAGEFPMLDRNVAHTVTLRAKAPSIVAEVSARRFLAIAREYPIVWKNMAEMLAERLRLASPRSKPWHVFVGHGRDRTWQRVETFLRAELHLEVETYESISRAGYSIVQFLQGMLERATFAVIVCTAEDVMEHGGRRPRQNVLHEAGLFQGRLGFDRVVLLRERGSEDFSNASGLQCIEFAPGAIEAAFPELRRALEREGHVPADPRAPSTRPR